MLGWGSRAVFAVLDQGLLAGSGFAVNILLARWLSPESFGVFAVAYSVFFFASTFYTQMLLAPMLVFGVDKYAEGFRRYLGLLICGHLGIVTAMSLCLTGVAAILLWRGFGPMAQAFVGLAIAAPFVPFLWLMRSAFYVRLQPQWAALGSGLYFLLLIAGLFGVSRMHTISPALGLIVMGSSSLIVGMLSVVLLRPLWPTWRGVGVAVAPRPVPVGSRSDGGRHNAQQSGTSEVEWDLGTVVRDHVRYGKWSLAAAATNWVVTNLHYLVLSATAGLGAVAAMRVLDTALSPYFNLQLALSNLLIPVLSARAKNPASELLPCAIRLSVLWASLATLAYLLVRMFAPNVIALLYGGRYAQYSHMLSWYGLVMIPLALGEPFMSTLRALVRTDLVFLYQSLLSAALFVGYLIAARHGLPGVILVLIIVNYLMVPLGIKFARGACILGNDRWVPFHGKLSRDAIA